VAEVLISWSRALAASAHSAAEVMGTAHSPASKSVNEPLTTTMPG